MISANELTNRTLQASKSEVLEEIESIVIEAAESGQFYTKLFTVPSNNESPKIVFVKHYSCDVLRVLDKKGYIITSIPDANDTESFYIGWGYVSEADLKTDLRLDGTM